MVMVTPPPHCPLKIPLPCEWEVQECFLLNHAQFVVYVILATTFVSHHASAHITTSMWECCWKVAVLVV